MQPDIINLREAFQREFMRGGQIYWVVPKIRHLYENREMINKIMPNIRVCVAHGQLPVRELERVMQGFAEHEYDVLLATNIIESGIDIPTANTMIIAHPQYFGLSQLYQLRGRIGRSAARGYCYILAPNFENMPENAKRRLEVIKSLNKLGSGFNLASYDMDIRGAGNLLGEEQSGHIREVGIELYQNMLEDAVRKLRSVKKDATDGQKNGEIAEVAASDEDILETYSPQININLEVLIPNDYIENVVDRLDVYKRLARAKNSTEVDEMAAEMKDRFGKNLSESAQNLLELTKIKIACRTYNIQKIEVGDKAIVFSFRNNLAKNVENLIAKASQNPMLIKLRPDNKLQYNRDIMNDESPCSRLQLIMDFMFKN
jgi:transcription-repair coupling factor (superfamily II helicase)